MGVGGTTLHQPFHLRIETNTMKKSKRMLNRRIDYNTEKDIVIHGIKLPKDLTEERFWLMFERMSKTPLYKNKDMKRRMILFRKLIENRNYGKEEIKTTEYRKYITSIEWKETATKLKREREKCELCGCSNHLVVHHISYDNLKEEYKSEIQDNWLMVVCISCHQRIHKDDLFKQIDPTRSKVTISRTKFIK